MVVIIAGGGRNGVCKYYGYLINMGKEDRGCEHMETDVIELFYMGLEDTVCKRMETNDGEN